MLSFSSPAFSAGTRAIALLVVSAAAVFAQDTARMDAIVRAAAKGDRFMGSVLVAKDDQILFEHTYGWANAEWKIAPTPSTKYRIGSDTKQFTAAAILLLEEQGKLSTTDLVSKFVPDCPAAWSALTLHHLLGHTSGIPNFTALPDYDEAKRAPLDFPKVFAKLGARPLDFAPGGQFRYSNSGYLVLGYVVEKASGQTYAAFLKEKIFTPLGMADTGVDSNSAILPERADGYLPRPGGLAHAAYINMSIPHGAGALYSTPRDLHRWTQALFGGKVLSAASLAKMITPGQGDYAYGLLVHTVKDRKIIEHGGGIDGFTSHLAYYPESKLTVVALSNVGGPAPGELAPLLASLAFGETVTLPEERREVDVPAATLRGYVGVYQLAPGVTNTIRLSGHQLTVQLTRQGQLPIFPESDKKFFLKIVNAQIEFVTDDSGKVTHLLQTQNGRTQKAPRISDTVADAPERKAITLPASALAPLVGTYELRPGFALVITLEGDQLMSQATNQAKIPIFPESDTKFFLKVIDAQLEFTKDATGAATHLTLHQNGRSTQGPRKP